MPLRVFAISKAIPRALLDLFPLEFVTDTESIAFQSEAGICDTVAWVDALFRFGKIDCALVSTECDQMRRATDVWRAKYGNDAVFLLNVPAVIADTIASRLFAWELERLIDFLSRRTGTFLEPDTPLRMISAPNRSSSSFFPNVAIVGGPLFYPASSLNAFFYERRFQLAPNLTEMEPLLFSNISEVSYTLKNLSVFAHDFICAYHSIFRKPNTAFYQNLFERVRNENARGIILVRTSWCDQWRTVYSRLHEISPVPVMEWVMDFYEDFTHNSRLMTRLEAFLEQIGGVHG